MSRRILSSVGKHTYVIGPQMSVQMPHRIWRFVDAGLASLAARLFTATLLTTAHMLGGCQQRPSFLPPPAEIIVDEQPIYQIRPNEVMSRGSDGLLLLRSDEIVLIGKESITSSRPPWPASEAPFEFSWQGGVRCLVAFDKSRDQLVFYGGAKDPRQMRELCRQTAPEGGHQILGYAQQDPDADTPFVVATRRNIELWTTAAKREIVPQKEAINVDLRAGLVDFPGVGRRLLNGGDLSLRDPMTGAITGRVLLPSYARRIVSIFMNGERPIISTFRKPHDQSNPYLNFALTLDQEGNAHTTEISHREAFPFLTRREPTMLTIGRGWLEMHERGDNRLLTLVRHGAGPISKTVGTDRDMMGVWAFDTWAILRKNESLYRVR